MSQLETGMLVQHASLGLGKIVALEPKAIHVFFAAGEARFAAKLRLPMALSLLTPSAGANAWLSGLSGFTLDARSGRYARAGTWLSHADAVARFLEAYPGGFTDPAYGAEAKGRAGRVFRWRQAHDAFLESLGRGEGERLLLAGDVGELTARALRVARLVRTLDGEPDRARLEEGLQDPEAARGFFAALFALLAEPAPGPERFGALAAAVAALPPGGEREAGWPTATLLPFVARPDVHLLLRPRFACEVARRLGLEFAYEAAPGWATYDALLRTARSMLEKLRPLGARDHVDVEAFMQAVATKHPRPKRAATLAA